MSKGLTQAHIEAFKARLAAAREPGVPGPDAEPAAVGAGLPRVDLGRVGVTYWRDRARQAEADAAAARARLEGVLTALRALGLEMPALESADARTDDQD